LKKKIGKAAIIALITATFILWPDVLTVMGTGGWSSTGLELFIPILLVLVIWLLRLIVKLSRFLEGKVQNKKEGLSSQVIPGILVGWLLGILFSGELRMYGFELAAERSEPLIKAIERYIHDNGEPPDSMAVLVPTYLAEIPAKLPPIEIITDPERLTAYGDTPWVLSAMVSKNLENWDLFIYFPDQEYPERGFGGVIERLGAWAYVHE
jgi:hypothetical protein